MKSLRTIGMTGLYLSLIFVLYRTAVPRLESGILSLYHEEVVKRRVADKASLADGRFHLGLYRPELPYHFRSLYQMEDSLDAPVSIVSFYQAWGDGEEHRLSRAVLDNIAKGGFVPMITWEPWIVAFGKYRGQMRDSSLGLVARGEFDDYARAWAREAAKFGKPMFLRFAHEFSNPWYAWSGRYGNDSALFKAAWRHVHGIFREEGARNVAFVWNPYQAGDTAFYPGGEYVDWIGLDVFNYGPLLENGFWMDFYSILHGTYGPMQALGKPILIAETGCVAAGGDKNVWYRDMLQSLVRGNFPQVKGLVLFDNPAGKSPNGQTVDLAMTTDSTVYKGLRDVDLKMLNLAGRRRR